MVVVQPVSQKPSPNLGYITSSDTIALHRYPVREMNWCGFVIAFTGQDRLYHSRVEYANRLVSFEFVEKW